MTHSLFAYAIRLLVSLGAMGRACEMIKCNGEVGLWGVFEDLSVFASQLAGEPQGANTVRSFSICEL
ncbi:hypothetical protein KC19_VG061700 [Ceratodon purpureus]|uniref:Secreted protein n=1 Tax=Ceratodon purpureus TaxID=3225 RepID=A0A8T0HMI9_CERPU|nr:hypothetical protein KC19_VG061700 [Ceratodon purpureus]